MSIELLDCSLRDGAYVNNGEFGADGIKKIIRGLSESAIEVVECGWLFDDDYVRGKTYFQRVFDLEEFLPEEKKSKYSLMLYHDRYNLKGLQKNAGKIDIIREIFHKDKFKEGVERSQIIRDLGYELFYQVVNTSEYSNRDLMELAGLANRVLPSCIYIVDTNGSMFFEDLKRIFEILNENLDDKIKIGFHSHNNLQLSFSLAINFIELGKLKNRNIIMDSSLFGIGRGAGNLNTELVCEYLNKFYFKKYDLAVINQLILDEILKFKKNYDWGYNVQYLISGSYNIHSRYAKYLTDKYNVNPEVLREVFSFLEGKDRKVFCKKKAEDIYRSLV